MIYLYYVSYFSNVNLLNYLLSYAITINSPKMNYSHYLLSLNENPLKIIINIINVTVVESINVYIIIIIYVDSMIIMDVNFSLLFNILMDLPHHHYQIHHCNANLYHEHHVLLFSPNTTNAIKAKFITNITTITNYY